MTNNGMCSPLSDLNYFNLITTGGTDKKAVKMIIKYYPELKRFVKEA